MTSRESTLTPNDRSKPATARGTNAASRAGKPKIAPAAAGRTTHDQPKRSIAWVTRLNEHESAQAADRMRRAGARRPGDFLRALLLNEDPQAAGDRRPARAVPSINLQCWADLQRLADTLQTIARRLEAAPNAALLGERVDLQEALITTIDTLSAMSVPDRERNENRAGGILEMWLEKRSFTLRCAEPER